MILRTLVIALPTILLYAGSLSAQQGFELIDLSMKEKLTEAIEIRLASDDNGEKFVRSFDVDDDKKGDIQLLTRHGRGPLSTYFTSYHLRAFNGIKFLRLGMPIEKGEQIEVADLFRMTTDRVSLCSVGSCLRMPNESFEKFSSGDWWGREGFIAMMSVRNGAVKVGYAKLKVTKLGEVTLGKTTWQNIELPLMEIK